ncbi:GM16225 [Drosophila sechellia]|uniref:GM16225 n=1 Tax=Drosophila sechellia TaxID=7238 RepID=B4IMR5_DROSE|nr:GM16225 [Drosophila sechellia]
MLIRGTDQTPYGQLLLRTLRNKVIGKADEALNMQDTKLEWDSITDNLKRMYACKKSEPFLISEIQNQPDGLPFGKLFHEITRLRSELLTLATDSEQGGCAASRRALYDGICLNAFLVGILDPLRTVIRARNPSTIEQAHEWCQAEQSFMTPPYRAGGRFERYRNYSQNNYRPDNRRDNPFRQGESRNYDNRGRNINFRAGLPDPRQDNPDRRNGPPPRAPTNFNNIDDNVNFQPGASTDKSAT